MTHLLAPEANEVNLFTLFEPFVALLLPLAYVPEIHPPAPSNVSSRVPVRPFLLSCSRLRWGIILWALPDLILRALCSSSGGEYRVRDVW